MHCSEISGSHVIVPEAWHSSIVAFSEALHQAGVCKNHMKHHKLAVLLLLPVLNFNNDLLLMLLLSGGLVSFAVGCVAGVSEAHAAIFSAEVRRWRRSIRITRRERQQMPSPDTSST